jgi:predicted transposase YbfD/YdcC
MLETLPVKEKIISTDAMHCQTETAALAQREGADYMLQVKDNQKYLKENMAAYFHKIRRDEPEHIKGNQFLELDGEHARIVQRQYTVLAVNTWIAGIENW